MTLNSAIFQLVDDFEPTVSLIGAFVSVPNALALLVRLAQLQGSPGVPVDQRVIALCTECFSVLTQFVVV